MIYHSNNLNNINKFILTFLVAFYFLKIFLYLLNTFLKYFQKIIKDSDNEDNYLSESSESSESSEQPVVSDKIEEKKN